MTPETEEEIVNQIIWNNRYICIDNKSVFKENISKKAINKVGDLFDTDGLKINKQIGLLSGVDMLYLNGIYHALPITWRRKIKETLPIISTLTSAFRPQLSYITDGSQHCLIENLTSKKVYNIFIKDVVTTPTAKGKFDLLYANRDHPLDWERIYLIPFKSTLDTVTREFQYKLLNQILVTNTVLFKMKKVDSPLCSFCHTEDEALPHLFSSCAAIQPFWISVKAFLRKNALHPELVNEQSILLGVVETADDVTLLNHLILLAKRYIYKCRFLDVIPSYHYFTAFVKRTYTIECLIAKKNNKMELHYKKWDKILSDVT